MLVYHPDKGIHCQCVQIIEVLCNSDSLVAHTCGRSGCDTTGVDNEACFPIYIDKDDPNFSDKECLMFVRSQEYVKDSCEIGESDVICSKHSLVHTLQN